ncbi:uncharacterized protein K441DRAFT_168233 [Cenococcum geophilum 1.58]|uniref:uncharacterized protein n=1 Tax=Cenococcum geophilum 1.58 TaxID=794803 RepID=UPI00358EBBE0|nr:hypothetical protein K441DRAFT_168233 [Cenococcum geophilum 1.58]
MSCPRQCGWWFVLVNICISDLFGMRHRGLYIGLTSLVWGFVSGIGPLLGGLFTQRLSWRWGWWINLPISLFSFIVLLYP